MSTYKRHRFRLGAPPPDVISYAVWLYYRFNLSLGDIEDLLAERGITVRRFTETLPALRRRIKIQENQLQGGAPG